MDKKFLLTVLNSKREERKKFLAVTLPRDRMINTSRDRTLIARFRSFFFLALVLLVIGTYIPLACTIMVLTLGPMTTTGTSLHKALAFRALIGENF
jgi:hypothetical protein